MFVKYDPWKRNWNDSWVASIAIYGLLEKKSILSCISICKRYSNYSFDSWIIYLKVIIFLKHSTISVLIFFFPFLKYYIKRIHVHENWLSFTLAINLSQSFFFSWAWDWLYFAKLTWCSFQRFTIFEHWCAIGVKWS